MDGPVVKIKPEKGADIRPDDLLNAEYKRKGKNYSLPDEDKINKRQKSGFFGKSKEKVSSQGFKVKKKSSVFSALQKPIFRVQKTC